MTALLAAEAVSRTFARSGVRTRALDDVTLHLAAGDVVGVVGESGSGKSTLARCLVRLEAPDTGTVSFAGADVATLSRPATRAYRRAVQMVFQDPYSSLDPRMTVEQIVGEGLVVHRLAATAAQRRDRVVAVLESVGLGPADLDRHPRSFSGGQRQRIAIARALVVEPQVLICDEVVSSLDVSVQAQVLALLRLRQAEQGFAMVFIAHDLAVVRHLCPRVVVMQAGRVVEEGPREQVFGAPRHPYTQALLAAVPVPDPTVPRYRPGTAP